MTFDFLIIGGGPAGMAAAIQGARLGLSTAVLEKQALGGQANAAPWIENYPGFPDGVSGCLLMSSFERQLKKWPIDIILGEAIDISVKKKKYLVHTSDKSLNAGSILLAIGLVPKLVGVPGEIPYGDPNQIDHTSKSVIVIGGGDAAFDLASSFAEKAKCVTVAMRGDTPRAMPKLVERALASGVKIRKFQELSSIPYDVVISCAGKEPRHPLLAKLQRQTGPFELKAGEIEKAPGLFLAGDVCRGQDRHIAIAAGDGMAAAQAAWRYVNDK
jgi:thioredoxin reductase (NADPH)